jgi:hypothetical protein
MKHELKAPITGADGKIIKWVEVKPVKVKHLKAAELARANGGGDMMAGIALLAAVTELPVEVIEELDARDFTVLSENMADFLPKPA